MSFFTRKQYTFAVLSAVAASLLIAETVLADIPVRVSRKDDHTRVVIDGGKSLPYNIQIDNTGAEKHVNVSITSNEKINLSDAKNQFTNLKSIDASTSGNTATLTLHVPTGSDIRDFDIGGRIIIDINDPPGGPVEYTANIRRINTEHNDPPPHEQPHTPEPAQTDAPLVHDKNNHDGAQANHDDETHETALPEEHNSEPEAPKTNVVYATQIDKDAYSINEPHVIKISATETLGLSAFNRFGYLWLVHDQPNNNIPPQIIGPKTAKFPDMERFDLGEGIAFRLKLPENNVSIYTEGGTLLWRVIITPEKHTAVSKSPERQFLGPNKDVGALFWPLRSATNIITFRDPDAGDDIHAVTVSDSSDFAGPERNFVELYQMPSFAGTVIKNKTDNLGIRLTGQGVLVTNADGLNLTKPRDIKSRILEVEEKEEEEKKKQQDTEFREIFNFDRWIMGGPAHLVKNEFVLLSSLKDRDDAGRTEDILSLAKLSLANNRSIETLGYLDYALAELPSLSENIEFIALRGAANTLAGRYKEAVTDLFYPGLNKYEEAMHWRAATLAGLGDWQSAGKSIIDDISVVRDYPHTLRHVLALPLAEVALRAGNVKLADAYLTIPKAMKDELNRFDKAELDYLTGESHRQRGEIKRAIALWEPLTQTLDKLYRVKAGLALTRLLYDEEMITIEEAIERMELLRFSWRGDTLETRANYQLGLLYLKNGNYLRGLNILKRAAKLTPDTPIAERITQDMSKAFQDLFLTETIDKLPPLEAVSVYKEFQELTPPGKQGDTLISNLAERLVQVELLGQASSLFDYLIDRRLKGVDAARTASRLAAIYLIDALPDKAMKALNKARRILGEAGQVVPDLARDINLLEARALADGGNTSRALEILSRMRQDDDVLRLRADIAWQEGKWQIAAQSLELLIAKQRISIQSELTDEQATMILNWAVALNLSDERRALASLRNRFTRAMAATTRAKLFEVVTRPRQSSRISDRNTISSIVTEVDLFRNFLETYRETKPDELPN